MEYQHLRPTELAFLTHLSNAEGKVLMRFTIINLVMEGVLEGKVKHTENGTVTKLSKGEQFDSFTPRAYEKIFLSYFKDDQEDIYTIKTLLQKVKEDISPKDFLNKYIKQEPSIQKYLGKGFLNQLSSTVKLSLEGKKMVSNLLAYLKERNNTYKYTMSESRKLAVLQEMESLALLLPSFDQEILPQFKLLIKSKIQTDGDEKIDDFENYFDEAPLFLGSLQLIYKIGGIDESGDTDSQDDGGEGA
ncbi:hypothetical protein [Flammeovirga sp. SubArs3]|uniref:hypothetical protein n=1 Tax=Flammeovirga sp. SubArs3 TaxID=2995316 RepID=UPI00248C295F|nr:hypothetical protein [Flammeovirga sp. SubArs3]